MYNPTCEIGYITGLELGISSSSVKFIRVGRAKNTGNQSSVTLRQLRRRMEMKSYPVRPISIRGGSLMSKMGDLDDETPERKTVPNSSEVN